MAAQLAVAIQAIWETNREETIRRVRTLEHAAAALRGDALDDALHARAERDAHKLAGSLGMFGFHAGSELAREFEQTLATRGGPAASDAPRLAGLVLAIREELDRQPAGGHAEGHPPPTKGRALLVVGPDRELTERLSREALGRNLRPRTADTSAGARRLAAAEPPDVAVLDMSFTKGAVEDLGLLEDLTSREPPVPVVVLTGSEALVDRVEVARRGGRGFVQRTRPARHVIDVVDEVIARHDRSETKVLALDDDPAILAALEALLAPRGLAMTTLNDPLCFWDALEQVRPDLLILNLDMPQLDGIDLCRAVRADSRFVQLPVLFLTARTDAGSVQRIFEAGADDYVSKPIVGPELVTRILNRLERVTLLRQCSERDTLTGVSDRRTSTAALDDLIAMSDRFGQPLSLALVDLDAFKQVNDRLGHAAGDAALQRIGALLLATFRGEDVVGRWGGDEFVVGMYGMARNDAARRMTELLERFRGEEFAGRGGVSTRTSFTAGVAEYPSDGHDLHQVYKAADEALYTAKAAGRSRVLETG